MEKEKIYVLWTSLVQRNWYCEREGNHDKVLTLRRALNKPLLPQRFPQAFLSCFSRALSNSGGKNPLWAGYETKESDFFPSNSRFFCTTN